MDGDFNFAKSRRRSNSSSGAQGIGNFKTKFDVNEPEPVFEEDVHGPQPEDEDAEMVKTDSSVSEGSESTKSN